MHPITALMLSRTIEADRRREIERRPHRIVRPKSNEAGNDGPTGWSVRIPRFGLAASKA